MDHKIKLPPRLKVIAGYIERDACVADVGTDHGLLPAYLAQNSLTRSITATDISAGSLRAALRTAEKYAVTDKITFAVADGLEGVEETETDTVVAAGLGGETIIGILKNAPWTKKNGVRLILQPQTKTEILYGWLTAEGYIIRDATLARDKGRLYIVILAEGSGTAEQNTAAANTAAVNTAIANTAAANTAIANTAIANTAAVNTAIANTAAEQSTAVENAATEELTVRVSLDPEIELLSLLGAKQNPLLSAYVEEQIKRTYKAVKGTQKSRSPVSAELEGKLRRLKEFMEAQQRPTTPNNAQ